MPGRRRLRSRIAGAALGLAAATVLGASATADAGTISVTADRAGSDAYSGQNGGEFKVTAFSGAAILTQGANVRVGADSLFQTFCLERNEVIVSPADWAMGSAAVLGGVGGGNPDPLSGATAYLYTQFWNGMLSNYEYVQLGTSGRAASASSLQNAIWFLEDEFTASQFYSLGDAQAEAWVAEARAANWAGTGGVSVLNLTVTDSSGVTKNHQDVLFVMVPLPPSALTGLGLLAGLGAVGAIRRRRRLRAV